MFTPALWFLNSCARARRAVPHSLALVVLAFAAHAGVWTAVTTDNFTRANSAMVGNGWVDAAGVGSIAGNTLKLTVPALGAGTDIRVSRPVAEASLYQRIEATYTLAAVNDGLSHSVYLRGKSLVIGGQEIYPVIMVNVRHTTSGVVTARLGYQGGAGVSFTNSSNTFSSLAGNSYTLTVQVANSFPVVVVASLRNNTAGTTPVSSVTFSDLGEYATNKIHLSRDFISSGVMGVAMEGGAGKSVSFTGVTTYSWSESGAFTAGITPVASQSDGVTYLASPFPSGGTPPYRIRWYRGASGFTPPTNINGIGGSGTYLGDTFECADINPPAGVTNSSIYYRAVYFDNGANATTGILSALINKNSPISQSYAVPIWIGDSITAGYATSSNAYTKSPATYAQNYLNADAAFLADYTMPVKLALNNLGLSGRTSTDLAQRRAQIIGVTRLIGANFAGIMLGTNDSKDSVRTTAAQYKTNIQDIIAALKATRPDMKIVLNKPTWFKPATGFAADFSADSLTRLDGYRACLDQLADGASIVVGGLAASNEFQSYGWTGTAGSTNVPNATTAYPPAPTGGKSYLVDGLHPYDGGAEMMGKLEWGPNAKKALLGNFTPLVNAGANQTITLPTSTVTLTGSATSAGHSISAYAWTKVQGGAATIVSPASASTQITGLAAGVYVFRLTATDNVGSVGLREVQVTVNSSGFASWLGEHGFGGDASPAADPDGNGLGHLAEYAFGFAPGATDASALPRLEIAEDTLRYIYPSPRADIVYQPQWSLDLIEWNTSGFVVEATGDITTAELAIGGNPRLFLRLKITLAEA